MMVVVSFFNYNYWGWSNHWNRYRDWSWDRDWGGIHSRGILRLCISSYVSSIVIMKVFEMNFMNINVALNTKVVDTMRRDPVMEIRNMVPINLNLKPKLIRLHHLVKETYIKVTVVILYFQMEMFSMTNRIMATFFALPDSSKGRIESDMMIMTEIETYMKSNV